MKQIIVVLVVMLSGITAAAAISLSAALDKVAKRHGVVISYSPTLTRGVDADAVPAGMNVDECLSALLDDTDFSYKQANDSCYFLLKDKTKIERRKKREAEEAERAARERIEEYLRQMREERLAAAKAGGMIVPQLVMPQGATVVGAPSVPYTAQPKSEAGRGWKFALKTNALLWAATSPNVAFEMAVGKHFSVELPVSVSQWTVGGARLHHVGVFPAFKYWAGDDGHYSGDFVGVYAGYVNYDIGNIDLFGDNLEQYCYDGNLYSAGVLYGHRFSLSSHFALEAEIGMGYVYTRYHQSTVAAPHLATKAEKHKWSLTRLSLTACYTF